MSVYSPRRSFCPDCSESIKFYDNIPLLSYLVLGGKCRNCKVKISAIYPTVEVLTSVLFLVMYYKFGWTLELLHALMFVSVLIPIFVIDARHMIIPNVITLVGLFLGLVVVCLISYFHGGIDYLRDRFIGFIAGGLAIWLIGVVGSAIMKKKAMGMGDVKLMAIIGLYLGAFPALPLVVGLSAFGGAVIGTALMAIGKKSRKSPIPYGPFIASAAVIVLLWGDVLWAKYMQLAGWN